MQKEECKNIYRGKTRSRFIIDLGKDTEKEIYIYLKMISDAYYEISERLEIDEL